MSSSEEEEFQGDESSEEEFQGDDEDFEEEEDEELVADEEEESDEDDAPLATLQKKSKKRTIQESDDDESSDDDIPLAALKSPKKKAAPKKKKAPPKKKATKAKAAKPTKKKKKASTPSSSSGSFRSPSAAFYGSNCQKGQLIQTLLCRWWYAITWPENIPDKPPKHYDSLDGMPGVFVCTSGGNVGRIKDMRDMDKCPNFKNMAQKDSSELKELVITAIKEQKKALVAAGGSGTDTEKELNSKLKWAEKLNPDKADKEAVKVLKAAKLSL